MSSIASNTISVVSMPIPLSRSCSSLEEIRQNQKSAPIERKLSLTFKARVRRPSAIDTSFKPDLLRSLRTEAKNYYDKGLYDKALETIKKILIMNTADFIAVGLRERITSERFAEI